ncbi:hypothetical protein DRO66_06800 [Candidatus Bathyarchaeota archaeon]|nr:MAG: hypothetical protein DRO66_06800 [Candidatus Bathyarchaeota archaeon]
MKWKKLGRVFVPDGSIPWAKTHAYVPTPIVMGNVIRVYAAFWDSDKVKRVGFVDVSAKDPTKVLNVSRTPALDVGDIGTFDCDGVISSFARSLVCGTIWLYYVGWQELAGPMRLLFAGLAISADGGNRFYRYKQTPILERLDYERFIRSTSFVWKEFDGVYNCWYTSSNGFIKIREHLVPSYTIQQAFSEDGIKWGKGRQCLWFEGSEEFGLSRPWLLEDGKIHKMFYSIRKIDKGYTLGYAESSDGGYTWERKDNEIGLEKSEEGWDSEMVCFPSIVDYEGKRYMFYNGNNYGETGFGVAVLEES